MDKKIKKLIKISSKELYKDYIWRHDKKEWWRITKNNILKKIKPLLFFFLLASPVLLNTNTLSDGTNSKEYIELHIKTLKTILPKLEQAYRDIDKLSNSISKVAYKDLDESFIYAFLIFKWSKVYGLDPLEVAGIAMTESKFNPNAVSKADARGIMQIHRPAWKMQDYFDVEENIKKGAKILWMYKKSNPSNYLEKYSGGAENYEIKVRQNTMKIKKSAKPTQQSMEETRWLYQKIG